MNNFSHPYLGNSSQDIQEMLDFLGLKSVEELFEDIPDSIKFKGKLTKIPHFTSEYDVLQHIEKTLENNITTREFHSFLGGGILDVYIPASQDELLRRSEFYSAYTPYQPEISQGMLQSLFEYQSYMCELLEMDISNSSLYDWATALGEAALMCARITGKNKFLYTQAISPHRLKVLENYVKGADIQLIPIPYNPTTGKMDIEKAKELIDDETAGVYFENPNYFGIIEDNIHDLTDFLKGKKALAVAGVELSTLGIMEAPGNYGADVAIGEGQTIGSGPLSFGGPLLGVFTMKFERRWIRHAPGRIVGQTITQNEGEVAYVNTLQTREQHIRREKATSNICTNQALAAVSTTIHLSLLGPQGLRETGENMYYNAHYLADELRKAEINLKYSGEFFNSFVIDLNIAENTREDFVEYMISKKIFPGIPILNEDGSADYLVTTSYLLKKDSLDTFVNALVEWRKENGI